MTSGHVYLLEVKLGDGRSLHPVHIPKADADWEEQLEEALAHFEALYKGQGIVDVLYGRDLYALGASEPEAIPDWKSYRSAPR